MALRPRLMAGLPCRLRVGHAAPAWWSASDLSKRVQRSVKTVHGHVLRYNFTHDTRGDRGIALDCGEDHERITNSLEQFGHFAGKGATPPAATSAPSTTRAATSPLTWQTPRSTKRVSRSPSRWTRGWFHAARVHVAT